MYMIYLYMYLIYVYVYVYVHRDYWGRDWDVGSSSGRRFWGIVRGLGWSVSFLKVGKLGCWVFGILGAGSRI